MALHDIHITQEGTGGSLFARILAAAKRINTWADFRDIIDAYANPTIVGSDAAPYAPKRNELLHVVANRTITEDDIANPPGPGLGYTVLVVNGTATINGIGYAVPGTVIRRVWHSGSWQTAWVYDPSVDATTSQRGLVRLATTAQAIEGTDTARAVTPEGFISASVRAKIWDVPLFSWRTSVSGGSVSFGENGVTTNRGTTGGTFAIASRRIYPLQADNISAQFDFSKRILMSFLIGKGAARDGVGRVLIGKIGATPSVGDLTVKGFGVVLKGAIDTIWLQRHNGTEMVETDLSISLSEGAFATRQRKIDVLNLGNGSGVVWVDGSLFGNFTGFPTGYAVSDSPGGSEYPNLTVESVASVDLSSGKQISLHYCKGSSE